MSTDKEIVPFVVFSLLCLLLLLVLTQCLIKVGLWVLTTAAMLSGDIDGQASLVNVLHLHH
jgi:hypothetical protein